MLSCPASEMPGGKNRLFEEALSNKFFQVPLKASTVDGLMSLLVTVRTISSTSGSSSSCLISFGRLTNG